MTNPELAPVQTPEPHPEDYMIVCNVDTNCTFIDHDDIQHPYNHKDYFRVTYGGKPFIIKPGETKKMPRKLAEHYAKHLANHMLIKKDKEQGKNFTSLQSEVYRPAMINSILIGVDTWYNEDPFQDEGELVSQQVNDINDPNERAMDLGNMADPLMGVLKPEPASLDQILKNAGDISEPENTDETSIYDSTKSLPSKTKLLETCHELGIEVDGKESVEQLVSKVKAFA